MLTNLARKVLGDEYVDRAVANTDDFNRKFQDMLNEYCWGLTWTDEERSALEASAARLGVGPEQFQHAGGRFLLGIIWTLAVRG